MKKNILCLLLLFFLFAAVLNAQSDYSETKVAPQWVRDLRRAEIVAFGSFPFMYFFSSFGVDTYRWAKNAGMGFDADSRRYAPWPLASAGAVSKTDSEKIMTISIATGGAVLVALVDFSIERIKRSRLEKEIRSLPPGTPIIIRKPLYGEETPPNEETPGTPGAENP